MNADPVHLVCACNAAYNMPLCVMLASVVDNFDPDRELVIHIISNDAAARERDNVQKSLRMVRANLDRVQTHWYSIEAAELQNLTSIETGRFSRDTFARLFAPYLLPESCERAVYLDCDLVVLADLAKLYDSTADNPAVLHAARDLGYSHVSSPGAVFDYAERGIPADNRYFNAGVLVMNFKRWRERNLTPPMIDYLVKYVSQIHWLDQGVLNSFLYNDWVPLDMRWNQPIQALRQQPWIDGGFSIEEWHQVRDYPYIVHYTGVHKPWLDTWPTAPRRAYFFRYLGKTVYKNTVPHFPYAETILGSRLYYKIWSARAALKGQPKATPEPVAAAAT